MYDSKHRTTNTQIYENRKDRSGYSSTKREWNPQMHGFNEETSNHRKYMRTQSSSNNRVNSNLSSYQQQHENGEKKATKDTKKPLHVYGDWSEFKSSTGKTYFYNCKTEISQWEKPKGWPFDESSRTNTSSISSTNRTRKEESTTSVSFKVHTRYQMVESCLPKESSEIPYHRLTSENSNNHSNGIHTLEESFQTSEQLPINSNNRLPTSDDDNSRMSLSSTSSKESSFIQTCTHHTNQTNGIVLHSTLSESAVSVSTPISNISPKSFETNGKCINGNANKNPMSQSMIQTSRSTESASVSEGESPTPNVSKVEREQEIQKFYRAELIQHLTNWPSTQLEKQCFKLFDDYYGYSAKISTAFTELKALKSNFRVLEIKRNILTQKLARCQKHTQKEGDEDKNL